MTDVGSVCYLLKKEGRHWRMGLWRNHFGRLFININCKTDIFLNSITYLDLDFKYYIFTVKM